MLGFLAYDVVRFEGILVTITVYYIENAVGVTDVRAATRHDI